VYKSPPQTFRSRFCHKFCDLYASIYGNPWLVVKAKIEDMWPRIPAQSAYNGTVN